MKRIKILLLTGILTLNLVSFKVKALEKPKIKEVNQIEKKLYLKKESRYIKEKDVKVRSMPSIVAPIIGTIKSFSKVKVIGRNREWLIIKWHNKNVYILKEETSKESLKPRLKKENKLVGYFELTYYCPCVKCCGKSDGITRSGTRATEGRTVASNYFPLGSKIVIDNKTYTVEDTGGMSKNVIDFFVNSHDKALKLGRRKNVPIYLAN